MTMQAWEVHDPKPIDDGPLRFISRAEPEPGPREVRVRINTCGVCRTDLHIAEGDLEVRRPNVVPGHEIVGIVDALGHDAQRFSIGDRIGIAWLRSTCGQCRYCKQGDENLCADPRFTGWDDDGGYAQFTVVHEDYAYELPDNFDDEHVAPLLCAGIIGYRALKQAALPPHGTLGVYGFGGSAHIASQIALSEGATVLVMTRSTRARELALDLGAKWAGDAADSDHELDAAILFAPAGELIPIALEHLRPGGTLAIAGVHLSQIPELDYRRHLFFEKSLSSVTANTREDGRQLLEIAARLPIEVTTTPYPLERAADALSDLSHGRVSGAAVLLAS
jgi:alcohol dehydrogenase, propanol-preferring